MPWGKYLLVIVVSGARVLASVVLVDHLEPLAKGIGENVGKVVEVFENDVVGEGELVEVGFELHLAADV